ncbi:hypothetical protein ACJRO7_003804 [Eucalyptus globulus]|uniref:Uncharacterized protein n=1 Tax=Eucalyptus globulus TaxID=34317 RepID=A0ABD3IVI9_EUCGL
MGNSNIHKYTERLPNKFKLHSTDIILNPKTVSLFIIMATRCMENRELENWMCKSIATAAIAIAEKDPVEMERQIRAGLSRLIREGRRS